MGQDIHGGIEVLLPGMDTWHSVISLVPLADRNRPLWRWLFQRWGPFRPVAPNRGIPEDVSYELRAEIDGLGNMIGTADAHSFTWLTWQEIEEIDWDEGPCPLNPVLQAQLRLAGVTDPDAGRIPDSAATETRRDTLVHDPSWVLIFDLMRRLADDFGGDRVRIVVYFDG